MDFRIGTDWMLESKIPTSAASRSKVHFFYVDVQNHIL